MAHAQKPDLVFRRNGRIHLNRRGRQFSRLLAAELCVSAVVMLGTLSCAVVWSGVKGTGYPLHSPVSPSLPQPVRHRVPSGFNWTLHSEHGVAVLTPILYFPVQPALADSLFPIRSSHSLPATYTFCYKSCTSPKLALIIWWCYLVATDCYVPLSTPKWQICGRLKAYLQMPRTTVKRLYLLQIFISVWCWG